MKFLNVFCENRRATVYINVEKIAAVIAKQDHTLIEVEGIEPVAVLLSADELVRMLNGENKASIGFRAGK